MVCSPCSSGTGVWGDRGMGSVLAEAAEVAMMMLRGSSVGALLLTDRSDAAAEREEREREDRFRAFMREEDERAEADLEDLGYLRAVAGGGAEAGSTSGGSGTEKPLLFVLGKHVLPGVHARERLLRHALRRLEDAEEGSVSLVLVNTETDPLRNSPGVLWSLKTLATLPRRVWAAIRPPILLLHPSMSSLAFVKLLLPMLPAGVPEVESVWRVEELPERARRAVAASRGRAPFDYVLAHDADVLEEHPLSDLGLGHLPKVGDLAAYL